MSAKADLPTSKHLWRWHVLIETEGGSKIWHKSILLPLSRAQREAREKSNLGYQVRVEEDVVAVEKFKAAKAAGEK